MIITIDEVKNFSGIFPDTDDIVTSCAMSAESIVTDYLRYNPIKQTYTHKATGNGSNALVLNACPISGAVTIDGITYADYDYSNNIIKIDGLKFDYLKRYVVSYTAGYDAVNLPVIIKHTITQIAALLLTESGGHIGITSVSDNNSGSRTFINYSNFSKYLKNLAKYRAYQSLI